MKFHYSIGAAALAVFFASFPIFAEAPIAAMGIADNRVLDNELCLLCHANKDLKPETERGKTLNLYVTSHEFGGSFHKSLACVSCHQGAETFEKAPHAGGRPLRLVCDDCHDKEADAYKQSIHGKIREEGNLDAPACASCHGRHEGYPSTDLRSSVNTFRLVDTCGNCHRKGGAASKRKYGTKGADMPSDPQAEYLDSMHGRVAKGSGLIVAPTCNDCHGSHDIQPEKEATSSVNRANIAGTCAKCHVLVEQTYAESVHGQLAAKGDTRGPTCVSCHSSHRIWDARTPFHHGIDGKCAECHKDKVATYRETIHGKAIFLGRDNVASCSDCHGYHDMQPRKDPRSHVNEKNRLATCRKCHPQASEGFTGYLVHASKSDKSSAPRLYNMYMGMNVLILGAFGLYVVYLLIWIVRSLSIFVRDRETLKQLRKAAREDKAELVRFKPVDRLLHLFIFLGFVLLFITGMPLKFYDSFWAQPVIRLLRGSDTAAVLHRMGAILVLGCAAVHLLTLFGRFFAAAPRFRDPSSHKFSFKRMLHELFGPDTLWVHIEDFKDFFAQQRHIFGKAGTPGFGRWTYWEKINYWAVVLSVVLIAVSGLIMWFPETVTRALPGWTINLALLVHSDITLLAVGGVLTFHIFSANLRLEKFPLDASIFTGRVSVTTMKQERPRFLARLEREGRLEEFRVHPAPDSTGRRVTVGLMVLGLFLLSFVLVALVYWENIKRFLTAM